MVAARFHNIEIARHLVIKHRARLDIPDNQGRFPSHVATENHHFDMLMLFLQNGTDVNAQDSDGNTILHIALSNAMNKQVDASLAAAIMRKNPNPLITNARGLTASVITTELHPSFRKDLPQVTEPEYPDLESLN